MRRDSGIYCIRNIINNKEYIGSTVHIARRKHEHLISLRKGIHHNSYLQRSFNWYGEDRFIFVVLERNIPLELLGSKEIEYIMSRQTNLKEKGYNQSLPTSDRGSIPTSITKEKLKRVRYMKLFKVFNEEHYKIWSIEAEERRINKINRARVRQDYSVYAINRFTGEIVGHYINNTEASIQLNIKRKKIEEVLSITNTKEFYRGWVFVRGRDFNPVITYTAEKKKWTWSKKIIPLPLII